jgi:hypothetical protein
MGPGGNQSKSRIPVPSRRTRPAYWVITKANLLTGVDRILDAFARALELGCKPHIQGAESTDGRSAFHAGAFLKPCASKSLPWVFMDKLQPLRSSGPATQQHSMPRMAAMVDLCLAIDSVLNRMLLSGMTPGPSPGPVGCIKPSALRPTRTLITVDSSQTRSRRASLTTSPVSFALVTSARAWTSAVGRQRSSTSTSMTTTLSTPASWCSANPGSSGTHPATKVISTCRPSG